MPRCSKRAWESHTPPVPVTLLLWRIAPGKNDLSVAPGWACSPACLFGFARALQKGPGSVEQAVQAAKMLTELQAIYLGADLVHKRMRRYDPRIWKLISREQLHTIEKAAEYAHMASVP